MSPINRAFLGESYAVTTEYNISGTLEATQAQAGCSIKILAKFLFVHSTPCLTLLHLDALMWELQQRCCVNMLEKVPFHSQRPSTALTQLLSNPLNISFTHR